MTAKTAAEVRFIEKVKVSLTSDCWEWTAGKQKSGYGRFRVNGRTVFAHRWAYEQAYGLIPDGMSVCHTCDNPPCCNPEHLFLGTHADNMRDMAEKGRARCPNTDKTRCKRGHPYDEENTYINGDGQRSCRKCRKAANRKYDRKKEIANG